MTTFYRIAISAAAMLLAIGSSSLKAADSFLNFDGRPIVKVWHLYSGSDGLSHIEEIKIPLTWGGMGASRPGVYYDTPDGQVQFEEVDKPAPGDPKVSEAASISRTILNFQNVVSVDVGRSSPHELSDWHYAVHQHLIMPLQGNTRFDIGDGKDHLICPGEVIIAEDWTGKGHRSGCDINNKVDCVSVGAVIGPIYNKYPLRDPPH